MKKTIALYAIVLGFSAAAVLPGYAQTATQKAKADAAAPITTQKNAAVSGGNPGPIGKTTTRPPKTPVTAATKSNRKALENTSAARGQAQSGSE